MDGPNTDGKQLRKMWSKLDFKGIPFGSVNVQTDDGIH